MRVLICLFVLVLTGCPTPVCDPTETRCSGTSAEICGSDGVWRTLMNCADDGMLCCWLPADPDGIPAGHGCAPMCPDVSDGGE